jgi:adenosine deaminase
MASKNVSDFWRSLPKTEIHIHAEATVSFESYFKLNTKYGVDPALSSVADFQKLLKMDSLAVMIKNFFYLQTMFRASEDFQLVVADVRDYALRNNIFYMELFIAPTMILKQGLLDFAGIMDPLVQGFAAVAKAGGPDVRLLVDVSRSFGPENAMNNLNHVLGYLKAKPTNRILGIGLGGQEVGHPCRDYAEVFAKARAAGLHTVAHAGEEVGPESIIEAIDILKAERIGHGTSAIQDPALMDTLKKRGIPLEICPASNVITGKYVQRYEDHPILPYFRHGMTVTLNTDDPVLFSVELVDEYNLVAEKLGFTQAEMLQIVRNGIIASFMDADAKKKALADLDRAAGGAART